MACCRPLLTALLASTLVAAPLRAQPWAPGQEPLPPAQQASVEEARSLERLRRSAVPDDLRGRYLRAAHTLLQRYWMPKQEPRLLLNLSLIHI